MICHYWGSLVGLGPSGLTAGQRAQGIVGSALSLPFQFSPLIVTAVQKLGERRRVARWRREWQDRQASQTGGGSTQPEVI